MIVILKKERIYSDRGALFNYSSGLTLNQLRNEKCGLFWPFTWPKVIYSAKLDAEHPAMYQDYSDGGCFWQPDRKRSETDLGSIPPFLRGRFPEAEFTFEYYCHDCVYGQGGLYRATNLSEPFVFTKVSRAKGDNLLADMIYTRQNVPRSRCDKLQADWHRGSIFGAVRAMGRFCYKPQCTKRRAQAG